MRRSLVLLVLVLGIVFPAFAQQALPPPQVAARFTFTVNSTGAEFDNAPGNGVCLTVGGTCTLRASVEESNALGSGHILLDSGIYATTLAGGGDFYITGRVTISGEGMSETLIQDAADERVFNVAAGAALMLDHLTVASGHVSGGVGGSGGCISVGDAVLTLDFVRVTQCTSVYGGGLFVDFGSWVEIRDSQFDSNAAVFGGGIGTSITATALDGSTILVERSLFTENSGSSGGGGGAMALTATDLTLRNSTISGNSNADNVFGGGLYLDLQPATHVLIESSTITQNQSSSAGGLYIGGTNPHVTLRNSIVADNSTSGAGQPDCVHIGNGAAYATEGVNIIGTSNQCTDSNPAPVTLTGGAKLFSLGDFGGENGLQSVVPEADSPAVDAAASALCPPIDQRGVSRPQNGTCDIGATERIATSILKNGSFEPASSGGKCMLAPWKSSFAEDKAVKETPNHGECAFRFKAKAGKTGKMITKLALAYMGDGADGYEAVVVTAMIRGDPDTRGSVKVEIFSDSGDQGATFTIVGAPLAYQKIMVDAVRAEVSRAGTKVKKIVLTITSKGRKGKWYVDSVTATMSLDGTRSQDDGRRAAQVLPLPVPNSP